MYREEADLNVAMVIAKDEAGKFLGMKKELDYTDKDRYKKNPWETAGGKIVKGETPPFTAVRELGEEARITGIYTGPEDYPYEDWRVVQEQEDEEGNEITIDFYPVPLRVPEKEPGLELSGEHSDYEWMNRQNFKDMLPEHNVEGLHKVLEEFEE